MSNPFGTHEMVHNTIIGSVPIKEEDVHTALNDDNNYVSNRYEMSHGRLTYSPITVCTHNGDSDQYKGDNRQQCYDDSASYRREQ